MMCGFIAIKSIFYQLTVASHPLFRAVTSVGVDQIYTRPIILTWNWFAIIYVGLAIVSCNNVNIHWNNDFLIILFQREQKNMILLRVFVRVSVKKITQFLQKWYNLLNLDSWFKRVLPVNPRTHWQLYPPMRSEHVPPCWQGFDSHSWMLMSQWSPSHPNAQLQL